MSYNSVKGMRRTMNRTGRVIAVLWITLTCCTRAYADPGDDPDCSSILWKIVQSEAGDLVLEWSGDAALDNSSVELGFIVATVDNQCKVTNGIMDTTFSDRQLKLQMLCPNTQYKMRIAFSCATYNKTIWTSPGPPVNVTIHDVSSTGFKVSWYDPPGPGKIVLYRVNVNGTMFVNETGNTSLLYNDLLPFTNYQVQVAAKNEDFWGNPSSISEAQTKAAGAPLNVSVTSTASSLSLTWEDPETSVVTIVGFEVEWWTTTSAARSNITTIEKSYTLEDLIPYTNYTVRVRAKTSAGEGDWTDEIVHQTDIGIPGPPLKVSVLSSTNSSLSLTWENPVPFVGPLEGFEVEWRSESSPQTESTPDKSYVIKGLTPYTNYTIRVRARTSAGEGTWSEEVVHRTEIGTPYPPQNFTEVSHTNTSIYLKWEKPDPSTGPILYYTVSWSGGGENRDLNVTEKFLNITELKPYTRYTLKASAFTAAGGGPWTDEIGVQTDVGAPYAPQNFTEASHTNTSIYLKWEEPVPSTGPILYYMVSWSEGGEERDLNVTEKFFNITGLKPYTTYTLKVSAFTTAGGGPWTDEIDVQTDVGAPYPPQNFTEVSHTNTSIYLKWEEPDPPTGPILYYMVSWSGGGDNRDLNVTKKFLNITGLKPYTWYTLKVSAVTAAGGGPWTDEIGVQTDVGAPYAPQNFTEASHTNTSIYLKWEEPVPPTGPILYYMVSWSEGGEKRDLNVTEKFFNITGLKPYTRYTLKVSAFTTAGGGPWTDEIDVQTDVGVPYAPQNFTEMSHTNTSIYLKWEEPAPPTGPNLCYLVSWSGGGEERDLNVTEKFFNITGLKPYTRYTLKVSAFTAAGGGPWTDEIDVQTDVGVPDPPRYVAVSSFTSSSLSLTWKDPFNNVGPIKGFELEWRAGKSAKTDSINLRKVNSYTIEDLTPFTIYTIRLRSETAVGKGKWSEEVVHKTDVGVPHAPTALLQTSIKNTSVALTWKAPTPSTGPILSYFLLWSSSRGISEQKNTGSNLTDYVVSRLLPYVKYTFQVMAATVAGAGDVSKSITVETDVGVPHEPTALVQTLVKNTSIALTWKVPTPSTGPILNYVLLWSSSRNTSEQKNTGSNLTEYVVTGLLPYVNYTFQVLAATDAGEGDISKSITVQTGIGVPHAPTALIHTSVTNTSVALTWKVPTPSTGPILNYILWWSSSRSTSGHKDTGSNLTDHVVSELLPYVKYTFHVVAVTKAGEGDISKSITLQTDVGVPHAPKELMHISVKNTTITLVWQEPDPSTGPISNYIVRWSSERGGYGEWETRSNESRYEVLGLHPYLNYTFQVQGMTRAGRGEWSEKKTVLTDIGIPTIPRNLILERVTDVSVAIKWDQPQFPNGPQLKYEVRRTHTSDTNKTEELSFYVNSNHLSVQHMISSLLPYTHYSVRVAAITAAGHGPWTDTLLFQTRVGVPKPAILKEVTVRDARAILVEWSTDGHYPGPVQYSLQAWMGPGLCSDRTSKYIYNKEVKGSMGPEEWNLQLQTNTVAELTPYGIYYFLIVLRTSATDGVTSQVSEHIRISPEAAGKPTDVTSDCSSSSTEAKVSWKPPKQPNGVIYSYDLEYSMNTKWRTVNVPVKDPCVGLSHVLTELRPERLYKIRVHARVTNVTATGEPAFSKGACILPAGIPSVSNTSRLLAKGAGADHLTLEWTRDTFSEFMGSIVYYAVLVGRKDALGNSSSGTAIDWGPPWSSFNSGLSDFFQATPPLWNPLRQEPDPLQCDVSNATGPDGNWTLLRCSVGIQDTCLENETYCNGPLQSDTQYEMKIRAFTRGGYTETNLIYARTGPKPRASIVGALVAVIIVLLLMASLVTGGYVMKKKGYLDPLVDSMQSRFALRRRRSNPKPNESSLEHLERCTSPRPIKSRHFADHVRIMMSDSHLKFSLEFEMLKNESPHPPCSVAEMDDNRYKNRWMNIFPFDHSRVKLLPLSDEPGSDFINANYIPGYSSRREYIATQGPVPHTVDDFWRMLWEQSVSTVVMLTQCVERGKKKCEQYWPESGEARYYGDLRVVTVSESMLSSYVIRIFHAQLGSHERRIKQMHFTHWPDFGCPERPEDLINFVRAVRDHLPRPEPGPILVHCSAGVGRTGTFIAVDRLAQQLSFRHIPQNDLVNIYGTVLDLRNHRTNMVQTEDQYIYIHLCVRQLIRDRDAPPQGECEDLVYSNIVVQRDTGF